MIETFPARSRAIAQSGHPRAIAVFGHRGSRATLPENTLAGFAAAREAQASGIETDAVLSADGVAVLHHDLTLNPDMDRIAGDYAPPGVALAGLSGAALAEVDVGRIRAGSPYAARFPDQVAREGMRIPTLAAALGAFADLFWLIELKTRPGDPASPDPDRLVAAVLDAVSAAGALGRVALLAFDWRCLRAASRRAAAVPRVCLTSAQTEADPATWWGEAAAAHAPWDGAASLGAAWAPEAASVTPARIAAARGAARPILVWTLNEAAEALRHADFADAIITDAPGRIGAALRDAGFELRAGPQTAAIFR